MTKFPRLRPLRLPLLALLACLVLAGCTRSALYSQLDERQANEIVAALIAAGVDAEKTASPTKQGWEVHVDRSDFPASMAVLQAKGLPRTQYKSLGDMFSNDKFASSALEEKALYKFGLEQELSQTLSRIPGVVDARVHIAMPDRDPLSTDNNDSSASVVLFVTPDSNVKEDETKIRTTVKDGVERLANVNNVTVQFFNIPAASAPGGGMATATTARGNAPMALSSISPTAIAIAAGVVLLLALLLAFGNRVRARISAPKPNPPVWNG